MLHALSQINMLLTPSAMHVEPLPANATIVMIPHMNLQVFSSIYPLHVHM